MAFGIVHKFKGGTKAQFDEVLKRAHPDNGKGMPPGLTHLAAGPANNDFVVTAVWNSKQDFENFAQNSLGPALADAGDKGFQGPPEQMEFDVHVEQKA